MAETKRNIRWALSIGIWNDLPPAPFTEKLDAIKDAGFNGFRMTGYPAFLKQHDITPSIMERELSKRDLHLATLSFGGPADDPAQHAAILGRAREACQFLKGLGATELVVFSPSRVNKVLVREHLRRACEFYNRLGGVCGEYGIRAGLHNHSQGQLIETQDEVESMLRQTDPKRFHWSPDTVHLYIAGANIVQLFEKYADRLMFMDYIDGRYTAATEDLKLLSGEVVKKADHGATFRLSNQDLGDGEIDFRALHRILKRRKYRGWICVDHHHIRVSARHNFGRCMQYIREKLEPIYS